MRESDDRETARRLAPLVLLALATAYRVEDAFAFAVLAGVTVMVTTLVLVCWRRDADHVWPAASRAEAGPKLDAAAQPNGNAETKTAAHGGRGDS